MTKLSSKLSIEQNFVSLKNRRQKKRWSRRVRKLAKAGKLTLPKIKETKKEPIISLGKEETDYDKKKKERFLGFLKEKAREEKLTKPITFESSAIDRQKIGEIRGHLRTVIFTCFLCLAILTGLYYFEKNNSWLEKLNSQLEQVLAQWNWKL